MKHVVSRIIENIGEIRYYLTKTITSGITTYGVAIFNVNDNCIERVDDIWTDKGPLLEFIKLMADSQVTCVHLKELCEEFVEELYSI